MNKIEISHQLNLTDAKALINRDRKAPRFFIQICAELPIANEIGRCFPGMANLKISKADALTIIEKLLSGFDKRGATIRILQLDNCYFIG